MIKTSIEKISDPIGFDIGMSDNVVQANLLNGLCRGLKSSCTSVGSLDTQLCYITDELNKDTVDVLLRLVEFAKRDVL